MTDSEKVKALATEIGRTIDRYRAEMDMTLASVVGTLEVIKISLVAEQIDSQDS